MTNKIQLITALTLATILIAGGLSLTPQAFSTGNNGNNDKDWDKKDKKGGEDSNKYKEWKKENEKHDDDDDEEHDKIKICHIPPGNEGNAHTIEISESALASHLEHGDTLGACPDDDEEETAHLVIIRAITDDNNKAYNIDDFTISIDGVLQDLGLPIPIVPNMEHTITGVVPDGYKSVLIAGDPACPVNINSDTFTLKKGKTIVCTIYYDDLFVPGGAEGPNPTITIVNNVGSDGDYNISVIGHIDPPTGKSTSHTYTVGSHTQVTISGSDDRQILITGDGNCPENSVDGFVNIENGQNITCIYSDRPVVQTGSGVIFHYDTIQFNLASGIGCGVDGPFPCIADFFGSGEYIIVPDLENDNSEQDLTFTTLVLLTVLDLDDPTNNVGCQVTGIGNEETSGKPGFIMSCDFTGDAAEQSFNANFALIETA
jgi:hypothetical protein